MELVPGPQRVATCCGANSFVIEAKTTPEEIDAKFNPAWILISRTIIPPSHPFAKAIRSKRPENWRLVRTKKGLIPIKGFKAELPGKDAEYVNSGAIWSAPFAGKVSKFGDYHTIEGTHGLRSVENIEKALSPGVNLCIIKICDNNGKVASEYKHLKEYGFKMIPLDHKAYFDNNGKPRRMVLGFYEKED
jgi:hypothetical protein